MSEAQLLKAGFYLIAIAAVALIIYLLLSLIILLVKGKDEKTDNVDLEIPIEPVSRKTLDKNDEYGEEFEKRIVEKTAALSKESEEKSAAALNSLAGKGILSRDVREIIIPKGKMLAVKKSMDLGDVLVTMINNNISNCPVYYRSADDILGVVRLKVLLKKYLELMSNDDNSNNWEDCIETPPFLQGSISVNKALENMRKSKSKIAIVIDEYAKTIGIITQDDIICGLLKDINGGKF